MTGELPPAYRWLTTLALLPRMVAEALKLIGTVETPGPADNPVILGWAKETGLSPAYSDDAIPWCGLFMAVVAQRAGKEVPVGPLWARNWANFGRALQQNEKPSLGDVLVFGRAGGGGHVGLYIGEDATAFHVLGGNQSDRVCFTRIAKNRLLTCRRPIYRVQPATVSPRRLIAGGALSTNEA